jgi:hypothetical protein
MTPLTAIVAPQVAVGENSYFGAGNTWDTCESWLVDYQIAEYQKKLGAPLSDAVLKVALTNTSYTRHFSSGTRVALTVPAVKGAKPTSCVWWADGSRTGNAC